MNLIRIIFLSFAALTVFSVVNHLRPGGAVRRDLGDFQTPPALVAAVLEALGPIGARWPRVLEPTCGRGHFLTGLIGLDCPPCEVRGFEIQRPHLEIARTVARGSATVLVVVEHASLFDLDLRRDLRWTGSGPLLVVGNPPWVTNSELGTLGSDNLPRKSNLKGLRGIDALTGESNFDIAESIWLKLLDELVDEQPTIALLCKTSVARNVLEYAAKARWPVTQAEIRKIDARRWFGAAVDACLFRVQLGSGTRSDQALVYRDLNSPDPEGLIGLAGGRLVADLAAYARSAFADGASTLTWRQGLKHDAASVMELSEVSGTFRNKLGEPVVVEPEHLYPLLKSTDLSRPALGVPRLAVIVTQKKVGDETRGLSETAPHLWRYLTDHAPAFNRRQSSIYRGQPPFAMFGLGAYSFAPYKVAISGLHRPPRFHALGPVRGRPVMLDDTCYFVGCRSAEQAALLASLLNDRAALDLVEALVFEGSKRPITKRVLQRIDIQAVLGHVDRSRLLARAEAERQRLTSHSTEALKPWPSALETLLSDA